MTLSRKQQGFTIVELLIVIIVIAILATLVLVTFTGIQQSARNTQRQTDAKAVASHLETYNAKEGKYPSATEMNDDTFVASLKGLDKESTRDPKAAAGAYDFAATATSTQYGYSSTKDDGTACDNDVAGDECVKFTISYVEEGSGTTKTVTNL